MDDRHSSTPTFATYVARWLHAGRARYRPNTLAGYRSVLQNHVVPLLGARPLAEITQQDVRAVLVTMIGTGFAAQTVRMVHTAISSVFVDARLDRLVGVNPARDAAERLFPVTPAGPSKAMTPEELGTFLATARVVLSRPLFGLFVVLARCGLRLGEALALRVPHVRLADRLVRVEGTYHGGGRVGPTKTGRARYVDCSAEVTEVLAGLCDAAGTREGWLFAHGTQPYHPGSIQNRFAVVVEEARLPAHFTPHSLRHTYATLLTVASRDLQYVKHQLGHRAIATTADLYADWLQGRRLDVVDELDRVASIRRHPVGSALPERRLHLVVPRDVRS